MTERIEPIPFDPNRPRILAPRRIWPYKSEIRDGDVLGMDGRVVKMEGFG